MFKKPGNFHESRASLALPQSLFNEPHLTTLRPLFARNNGLNRLRTLANVSPPSRSRCGLRTALFTLQRGTRSIE